MSWLPHAGFHLEEDVRANLAAAGHEVIDFGRSKVDHEDDYPDFAEKVGADSTGRSVYVLKGTGKPSDRESHGDHSMHFIIVSCQNNYLSRLSPGAEDAFHGSSV